MKERFKLNLRELNIPKEKLLDDLKRVASLTNKDTVPCHVYDKKGQYSSFTLRKRFGSWNEALEAAGMSSSYVPKLEDDQLFNNLLRVWEKLGRQPQRRDMRRPISWISEGPYVRRFGSWNKALVNFIGWVNSQEIDEDDEGISITSGKEIIDTKSTDTIDNSTFIHKTSRSITEKLRFRVLLRDGFTCCRCGRSPLKERGVELEVDHKHPWSEGGETTYENLETLCRECNRGKSNIVVDYS